MCELTQLSSGRLFMRGPPPVVSILLALFAVAGSYSVPGMPPLPDLSLSLRKGEELNAEGNELFRKSLYDPAACLYGQAAEHVEEHAERGVREAQGPLAKFLSNKAAALLKIGCHLEALNACGKALMHEPAHGKARAMANEGLGRIEEGLEDCDFLLEREGRDTQLGMQCVEVRRRIGRLAKQAERQRVQQAHVPKPTHLCSDSMTLRLYFHEPPPAAVALGCFFPVSLYVANEFGLYDRTALQDSANGVEVCFTPLGAGEGVQLEARRPEELVLDRRGRASLQLRFVSEGGASVIGGSASVAVSLKGGGLRGGPWVMEVASLHVSILGEDQASVPFSPAPGGAWNARPLYLEGMEEPLLIAEAPDHGIPGKVWDGGLILAEFLARNPALVKGKRVVELGAGTGLVGVTAGAVGASQVLVTDLEEHVPIIVDTITLNKHLGLAHVQALPLLWGSPFSPASEGGWDLVLGSDIVYEPTSWDPLVRTIMSLSTENTTVMIAHRPRHEDDAIFWDALKREYDVESFPCESVLFPLTDDITIYSARLKREPATDKAHGQAGV